MYMSGFQGYQYIGWLPLESGLFPRVSDENGTEALVVGVLLVGGCADVGGMIA